MAITTPPQTIINESSDSTLNKIYPSNLQGIPALDRATSVYISQTQEYVTNYYNVDKASGSDTEVQFNSGSKLAADSGLTYNATTDSLTVTGNVSTGNLKTNNILYANGNAWTFSTYANSNVASYLPTYTGNLSPGNLKTNNILYANGNAWTFSTYANSNVANYLPTYTGNLSPGNLIVGTTANLGAVSNIRITGGTNGQVLTTNGSGNLSWTTVSSGSSFNGGTISNALAVSNSTASTNYNNGALTVTGGVGVGENLHVLGHIASETTIYAGHLSDFGSWTVPVFVGRDAGSAFIQAAAVNNTDTGSADWVAYGDSSDDTQGWADFGYTGTAFNDTAYTITKEGDGYFFVQGLTNGPSGPLGGNLVIATGGQGTTHDIVFATGGFLTSNEKFRYIDSTNKLVPFTNATMDLGTSAKRFGNIHAVNIALSGTGTTVDASQGNILTNRVTGTQFNFLHGSYSSLLQGNVSATANLTFTLPSSAGSSGQLLSSNGSGGLNWTNAPKDEPNFIIKYASFSIELGKRYIVDTLTQVASTTMPTTPTMGETVRFVDAFGSFNTYAFTINKSDKNIMGGSSYVASTAGVSLTLVYNGQEWRVFAS